MYVYLYVGLPSLLFTSCAAQASTSVLACVDISMNVTQQLLATQRDAATYGGKAAHSVFISASPEYSRNPVFRISENY